MNILLFLPDAGGCGWYRQRQPLWWLNKLGHKTDTLTATHWQDPVSGGPELLRAADVILCARLQQVGVLENLRDYNPNAAIVYDLDDDLLNSPPENPYSQLATTVEHEAIKANLEYADLVTVSTDALKEIFGQYNDRIETVPNCIDPFLMGWNKPAKDHLRIGWAGSSTHVKDIEPAVIGLKMALNVWNERVGARPVMPAFMGHLGRLAAESFPKVVWQQPVPFDQYYLKLHGMSLDIGLAPIRSHPFNNSKSSIKFLEYSAMGTATIASDFGPYKRSIEHEETGLLVRDHDNPKDWMECILWLLEEPELAEKITDNARAWCLGSRSPEAHAERLVKIYGDNLRPPRSSTPTAPKKKGRPKPTLTIGTLSWIPEPDERLQCLKRCLPLILARAAQSADKINIKHVILSQGSCDEANEFISSEVGLARRNGLDAEAWFMEVNKGVPAINDIFEICEADYLMKLDDDVIPCPNFTEIMLDSYLELERRSDIGMLSYDPEWGHETFGTRDGMKVVAGSEILKAGHLVYWLKDNSTAVGMCRLESSGSFKKIGGHPEDIMYGTDQIMADRFTAAGYSNAHLIPMIKIREKGMDIPSPLAHLGPTSDQRKKWKKEELHKVALKRGHGE